MEVLRKLWYLLRLSVRHPSRVPTWDAIVLTAASPEQAHLYDWQLQRAKRMGRIASSTITLAVPDPHGARIGSGAATLNALRALASRLTQVAVRHFTPVLPSKSIVVSPFLIFVTLVKSKIQKSLVLWSNLVRLSQPKVVN